MLNTSGVENLLTICHGDAKPGNFMFRTEGSDTDGADCGGMESVLFDWQAGFLGYFNILSTFCLADIYLRFCFQ